MNPHKQPRDAGVRKAFKGIVGNRPADKFERVERHRREVDRRKRETMWADRAPEDATAARSSGLRPRWRGVVAGRRLRAARP